MPPQLDRRTLVDACKKVKRRKRHLVVDTLGLLLAVSVSVEVATSTAWVWFAQAQSLLRRSTLLS